MGVLQGLCPLIGLMLLSTFSCAAQPDTIAPPLLPDPAAGIAQLQQGASRLQQEALLLTATAANVLPIEEAEQSAGRTAGHALRRGYQVKPLLKRVVRNH